MIIGITGNSGSGKTEFSKILLKKYSSKKTVEIINADEVVREMSHKGTVYYKEIVKEFGEEVLLEDKELNKQKLADIIFNNSEKKEDLDLITFKHIVQEIKYRINRSKAEIIIVDAPLLIEAGLNKVCDVVISVIADKDTRIERIVKRDGIEKEKAVLRVNAQKDDEFYINNSNYVIMNNDDNDLEEKVDEIIGLLA